MKKILTSKWLWIAVAVLVAVALVLVFFLAKELFKPALWTVLIIGALWILSEFALRAWKKRKRKNFDEGLTAKEGIEDRKREWQGFQVELDKQKIDRYELPFYLLVGEPQSGKSVLLQNSDLHFPFGQNKLSGIGGTRGCDWWFTEEAVILDLAGRLFTHEGGVADQLEWEAFLDLLSNFRPICPANGILLVLPCDSLLTDAADAARLKANKIQSALLTLVKKLDAQLPIYLVLTKADKLFGFAESVHRLDAPKRHEMFGWSREADKVDAPFDLEEARLGFRDMVARARLLRGEMLGSSRIPEALGEIDRMFAFPDELAALEEPLEIYLRRVFTDSGLADRLSFRGMYLTSGLQSGVPIARVCAAALGGSGDADMQELEALFTKQRAYFIKDLVRTRVFGERGIVRPTKGRVLAAQRSALIGYGVSGVIALVSLIGGMVYMLGKGAAGVDELTDRAMKMSQAAEIEKGWKVPEHLAVLSTIHAAIEQDRGISEEIWNSTRESLKRLYAAEFDLRLAPTLRNTLADSLAARIAGKGPDSFEKLQLAADCAVLLLQESNLASSNALEVATKMLAQGEREYVPKDASETFTLARAIELRGNYSVDAALSPTPAGSAIDDLTSRTFELYEDCLTPGRLYQPDAELGYMLAWFGVEQAHNGLKRLTESSDESKVFELMSNFVNSWAMMERCSEKMERKSVTPLTYEIKYILGVKPQLVAMDLTHDKLEGLLKTRQGAKRQSTNWVQKVQLEGFITGAFASPDKEWDPTEIASINIHEVGTKLAGIAEATANDQLIVPTPLLREKLDAQLDRVCKAAPNEAWKFETLADELEVGVRDLPSGALPEGAYLAKVCEVGRRFVREYPSWGSLAEKRKAQGTPLTENAFAAEIVSSLVKARKALIKLNSPRTRDFQTGIDKLLAQHLESLERQWTELTSSSVQGVAPTIDLAVLDALDQLVGETTGVTPKKADPLSLAAQRLKKSYVDHRQELMLDYWRGLTPDGKSSLDQPLDGAQTIEIVRQVGAHFALMRAQFGLPEPEPEDGLDPQWRDEVEKLLVDRLQRHEQIVREYWNPTPIYGLNDVSLLEVASQVSAALEPKKLEALLKDAGTTTLAPDLDNSVLGAKSAVFVKLPDAAKALESLRALRVPKSASGVRGQPYFNWLKGLAEGISQTPGLAKDGPELAKKLRGINNGTLGETSAPKNATGLYATALNDQLQRRLLTEVRVLYAADLKKLLQEYDEAIDALYVTDFEATKTLAEESIMASLSSLLDRNGKFDRLLELYNAKTDTLGLFPKDEAAIEREPLWAMQRFLGELQAFLLGEGKRIKDGKVDIQIGPVWEENSIWNTSKGPEASKECFFGPGKAPGECKNFQNAGRNMQGMPLEWNFAPDSAKSMRMRWSDSPNDKAQPNDLKLELSGSLAPLLFAWAGGPAGEQGDAWSVSVQPTNSKLRAPFEVSFVGRKLPQRPARTKK